MKKAIIALALTGTLLSGCVISIDDDYDHDGNHSSWSEREEENRAYISRLSTGDSISSVRSKMGVPDFDELVVKNGTEHRVLYYRTQRVKGDSVTTKDECTPILFVEGELVGFGEAALNAL